jgi:phosphate-selective porin OprO/OprP
MKTPYSYEYIKMADSDVIAPERSLFITNLAPNRQEGLMVHGQVLNLTTDYALGIFNGPRRSFDGTDTNKNLYGYLNVKPFLHSGIGWLEHLNVGASLNGGNTHNVTQPTIFQTGNDQSASIPQLNASPTFLVLNSKTIEDGARMEWAADTAYYYRSCTMLAAYYGGTQDYALASATASTTTAALGSAFATGAFAGVAGLHRVRVPLEGWTAACTCFLTGEQITRRVYLVEPIRPFGYYNGRFNPGAIEIYSRFSDLQLGHQIFTGGFADPKQWTNRANTVDTGVNWYWNHYVRLDFDWQHCMWGNPVYLSPTERTKHEEFYWMRFQLFF